MCIRDSREYWPGSPEIVYGQNRDYGVVGQEPYDPGHVILPEIMKKNGYATVSYTHLDVYKRQSRNEYL